MSSYYNGIVGTGIVLSATTQNPATIAASGQVTNTTAAHSFDAIYGSGGVAWTIADYGTVAGGGAFGIGVDLTAGGSIDNSGTGVITGQTDAIYLAGPGSVTNRATIAAASDYGIRLLSGGQVYNGASASVTGGSGGIYLYGGGAIDNSGGTIAGTGTGSVGVELRGSDTLVNAANGVVAGRYRAVDAYDGPTTISNDGTLTAGNVGVQFDAHGVILNHGAGLIAGGYGVRLVMAATVVNDGTIAAAGPHSDKAIEVESSAGGLIENGPTGAIIGYAYGIASQAAITIDNGGTISANGTAGIAIDANAGGMVANEAGALIEGAQTGVAFSGAGGSATMINSGNITGRYQDGVQLEFGGYVNNRGVILGGRDGISLGSAGTVVNDGVIQATGTRSIGIDLAGGGTVVDAGAVTGGGTAISLGGVGGSRLVLDPGYALGGGVSAAGGGNTLELADASSAGAIGGIGGEFVGFAAIAVDAGAVWRLAGNVSGGPSLTVAGTLTILGTVGSTEVTGGGTEIVGAGGVAIGTRLDPGATQLVSDGGSASGTIIESGGAAIVSGGGMASMPVIDGGRLTLDAGAVAGGAIDFASGTMGELQVFGTSGAVLSAGASISGFAIGDTIDLPSIPVSSVARFGLAAGNVLDITVSGGQAYGLGFDPMQSFAHEAFVLTSDGAGGTAVSLVSDTAPPAVVNDSPLTVLAGGSATIGAGLLRFDDAYFTHTQEVYSVTSGPADGVLLLNGSPIAAGGSFTQADIDNGLLAYQETVAGAASDAFGFTVTDAADNASSGQFDITIRPASPPPLPPPPPDTSVPSETVGKPYGANENTMVTLGGLSVSVSPDTGDPLTTVLSVAHGTLTAGNQTGASVTLSGTTASINAVLADVVYQGDPNYYGSDMLSMTTSDTIDGKAVTASASISVVENVTFHGGNGRNIFTWGNANGTAVAGNGWNRVAAGNGNDTVKLGNGFNWVALGNGNDSVSVGGGLDWITVGGGNDKVTAGNGINHITLGGGNDSVTVGNGFNTIVLGRGRARVTVGNGIDELVFTSPAGQLTMSFGRHDELVFASSGFNPGVDNGKAGRSFAFGDLGPPRPIAATLFSPNTDGTFATAGNRFAYDKSTGRLYYDARGSMPGSTAYLVADLTNHPHLTAADLFFTR
jgi:Ca2+-binding RTX toxin-like protein